MAGKGGKHAFYSPTIVAEVQALIDQSKFGERPPMSSLTDILDIFAKEHISQTDVMLEVDMVMVHERNRGGLGINAFNAHRNGVSMVDIGIDPDELTKM